VRLLGEILVGHGALSDEQLEHGLTAQREKRQNGRIGEVLVALDFCSPVQVLKALGEQLRIPVSEKLSPEDVDTELVGQVPVAFAKQHQVVPIRRVDGVIQAAVADPLATYALDDVQTLLGTAIDPILVPGDTIVDLINKVYERQGGGMELAKGADDEDSFDEGKVEELVDIIDVTDEAPIIRWVNSILFQAVKEKASDIHLEPGEREVIVRYRRDGVLFAAHHANRQYLPSVIARVKIMAGLNIAEKRLPQDGRIRRKIAGRDIDMRVATVPTAHGERVTMRLLDRSSVLFGLEQLGFWPDQMRIINDVIHRPHGIFLVTGPTGSGKTTTLYACLSKINSPDINILTVEDPVEYQLDGISQVQVNPKIDLTFASGLRSFLRHDPDVIMVGEIRDAETAGVAINASLTGHLVLSTVHTNDAASAITRLIDMGIEPFLVASTLMASMAQRLIRRVCVECREPHTPRPEELRSLGISEEQAEASVIYRARGCKTCKETGYRGRTAIYELLPVDEETRMLTMKRSDAGAIKRAGTQKGMLTLREDGARRVLAGLTTPEEVLTATAED
jgi:general secretion pathway protein E